MRYYKHLYLTEGLEKKKDRLIQKLEKNKLQYDIYLIALAEQADAQLEIYNSALFKQPGYPKLDLFVVGLAKGYDMALELVEEIVQNVYNETKGADIRSYILKKEREN
jgi:hypothetical protein